MRKEKNLTWNHLHKITKYEDAIAALEDVGVFMDNKGHPEEATRLTFTVDKLIQLHTTSFCHGRQSTLQEFFQPRDI